jgi:3-phenylpropionate/trans-cinnamate dioxygenase ferredoxin subunit
MNWHKLANSEDEMFTNGEDMQELEIEGKTVLLVRVGKEIYGCASKCPHAGARMKEGYVDVQGNLVCPLHKYRFDVKTGRNVSGEGYFLKRYLIMRSEEGVFINWQP